MVKSFQRPNLRQRGFPVVSFATEVGSNTVNSLDYTVRGGSNCRATVVAGVFERYNIGITLPKRRNILLNINQGFDNKSIVNLNEILSLPDRENNSFYLVFELSEIHCLVRLPTFGSGGAMGVSFTSN